MKKRTVKTERAASPLKTSLFFAAIMVLIVAAAILLVFRYPGLIPELQRILEHDVSGSLFVLLMLVLPIFGFPLSLFLVLVGMKFGIAGGLALTAAAMLVHMICTFGLVHSFLHDRIVGLLRLIGVRVSGPKLAPNRRYAVLFLLIPGPPYAAKNVLLALTDLPLAPYLSINWLAQFSLSIPFVTVGKGLIELDPVIVAVAVGLLIGVYLLQRYATMKYREARKKQSKS